MTEPLEPASNDNLRVSRSGWERLRDADMIAALSAVLVGVCALAISIYQSVLMRQQQQASVWPHVEIGEDYRKEAGGKSTFRLIVTNTGLGPARLMTLRVAVRGEPQRDWASTMTALGLDGAGIQSRATIAGRAILPGGTIEGVTVTGEPAAGQLQQSMTGTIPVMTIAICYCSVYDNCYRIDYAASVDTPVARCERDADLDFAE